MAIIVAVAAATGPCVLDIAIDPAINKPEISVGK
jgi:hypothetical protein